MEAAGCASGGLDRYRFLFEHAPIPIVEFDLSILRNYLDRLEGVDGGIEAFFEAYPEELFLCMSQADVSCLNYAARGALGAKDSPEEAVRRLSRLISGPLLELTSRAILGFRAGARVFEFDIADPSGASKRREQGIVHVIAPRAASSWKTVFVAWMSVSRERSLEIELAASERRYRRVFDHLRDLYIEADAEGVIRESSATARDILGYERSELLGRPIAELYESPEERSRFVELLRREGHVEGFQARFRRKSGERIVCSINAGREAAEDGSSFNVFDSIRDVSERVRDAEELRRLGENNALLFRELQHRVKNNLAILCSLVDLQLSGAADPKVRGALACVAARIRSFAKAHDMLLPAKDAGLVDLREYLANLLEDVCELYDERRELVRLEVKGAALRLDIDSSIRIGLIANELALNSLKHALLPGKWPRDQEEGLHFLILARVEAHEDGMIRLFFGDNGPGLPEGPGFEGSQGLGHLIIEALTSQLGGRFSALSRSVGMEEPEASGARFELVFPAPPTAGPQ